ncbi:MAG: ABC transporter substrate-binding protein [Sciscionella sp.]
MRHQDSSGRVRDAVVWAGCAVLLTGVIAACGSSNSGTAKQASSSQPASTWTDAILAPKGDAGFEYMAQARGYYKQQGVDVSIKPFNGDVEMVQALVSGAIDSAEVAPAGVYRAVLKGAHLKIIGATIATQTEDIYSKASIANLNDLVGKAFAASAPNSFPEIITEAMMVSKGIKPDFKLVSAGSASQRIQGMYSGKFDATAAGAQFAAKVKKNPKFHVLAQSQDVVPQYPRLMIVTTEQALKNKPKAAVKFLAAEIEGLRYAVSHPQTEITLAAQKSGVSANNPGVAYLNKLITDAHAVATDGKAPVDKLQWLENFLVKYHFINGNVDINKLVDDSYRQRALKLISPATGTAPTK